ncbi:hypothetical protein KBJ98_02180 [Flavobacterium sp. F-328]|uniref:Uncharacterized protein n=1 Tax=Flavobacterium erciyesense TaxID=2825842 RepID=A0ABS5D0F8_9FLAO|nr:hypothetical protein [Flavobacterium erciyesense]MBQ0907504.1 hypothetical protein [Flavobacterium erciyesense]
MRTRNNQPLDNKVFNIASTLFGFGTTEATKQIKLDVAVEKVVNQAPIKAIYPAIIDEAFSQTMDNYRQYIAHKNFRADAENELIADHNRMVRQYRKKDKNGSYINNLTDIQQEYSRLFLENKSYKVLNPTEYNEKVDEFCKTYGMLIQKRKLITVKYPTELIFQNLLCLYNQQLMVKNKRYMMHGILDKTPLEAFKVNSWKATKIKRNGVISLPVCKKTILNHRLRLEEFGVFTEYHFAGSNRAVELHINPTILVLKDLQTGKIVNAENQHVTSEDGKIVPNDNESTRTFINENQIKEVENSTTILKGLPSVGSFIFFTRTPVGNEGNPAEGAAAESVKVSPKSENIPNSLSDKLQQLIVHPQELAVDLAEGKFNTYKPIRLEYLEREAYSGTLLNEEYRELCIQDIFKMSAKIWKGRTPYAGSWKKAINQYYLSKFMAFTGNSFNKSNVFSEMKAMRWRLHWAMAWYRKNNTVNPLFPSDYFDFTRKSSKEVGFEYTKQKYSEHLKYKEKSEVLRQKQEAAAKKRAATINYSKKFEKVVNNFFKDKLTLTELYNYVEKNLPEDFTQKLHEKIEQKALKASEKYDFVRYDLSDF